MGEREKERRHGDPSLVEQSANDLSGKVYKLLYKEFLLTMIEIRENQRTTIIKETEF